MDLSVLLCTYNRAPQLAEALESLGRQNPVDGLAWELIVVDNNSKDDTRRVVEDFSRRYPQLEVIYLFEGRQGQAIAQNTGVTAARGDIIAFTDDDVIVDAGWLGAMWRAFNELGCTVMAGRVRALWRHDKPQWLVEMSSQKLAAAIVEYEHGDEPFRLTIKEPGIGANMAARKDIFERYGSYRTDIGPNGESLMRCHDTELFERVIKAGEAAYYVPDAIIDHPVEEFRTTKPYFLDYYFANGRSRTRMEGVADVPCIANIPRYMIRDAIGKFFKWQLTLSPTQRFRRKLHYWGLLGSMHEARLINAENQSLKLQGTTE